MITTTITYHTHRPILGARLWALALEWSRAEPDTQAAREAAIKACRGRRQIVGGSRSVRAAREAVEAAAAALRAERKRRRLRRAVRHLGYVPVRPVGYRINTPGIGVSPITLREPEHGTPRPDRERVRQPAGSLEDRLRQRTRALLRRASPMREGAAGGTTFTVELTRDPAAVGYTVTISANRDTYKGRYKGWIAREDHHRLTVPHGWLVRVYRRGLACVDGMLTLDAAPLDHAPEGIALYAAVWAEQGRGYEVHTRRGVLAVAADGTAYHGADARAAVQGLQRKLTGRRLAAEWSALAAASTDHFRAAVAPHADVLVRVSDARAIGACEYGVRSWCAAVGLDYEAGAATLAEVLAGYERQPAPEARLAILHALRRARREARLAA